MSVHLCVCPLHERRNQIKFSVFATLPVRAAITVCPGALKTACGPCTNRCSGRPMKHQSWRPCLRKPVDGGSWPGRLDILPHSAVSPWRRPRCQGAGSGAWRGGRRGRADVVDACRRVGHVNLRLARGRAAFLDHLRTGRRRCRIVEGVVCGIPREAQSVAEVFLICILFAKKPTRISYVMQLKCRKF